MMGRCISSLDRPVIKATNAIIAFNEKDARALEPTTCIHCGRCANVCPIGLNPTIYAKAMEMDDEAERFELLDKSKVQLCIECGCCWTPTKTPSVLCAATRLRLRKKKGGKANG